MKSDGSVPRAAMLEIYEDNAACEKFSLSMLYNGVNVNKQLNVEKVDNNKKTYFLRSRSHFNEMKRCQLQLCTDAFSQIRPSKRKLKSENSAKTIPNKISKPIAEQNETISIAEIPNNKVNFSYRRYAEENKMNKTAAQHSSIDTVEVRPKFDCIAKTIQRRSSPYDIDYDAIRRDVPARRSSVVSIGMSIETISSDGSELPPLEYKSSSENEFCYNEVMIDSPVTATEIVDNIVDQCGGQQHNVDIFADREPAVKNHFGPEIVYVENEQLGNNSMMKSNNTSDVIEDSFVQHGPTSNMFNISKGQEPAVINQMEHEEQVPVEIEQIPDYSEASNLTLLFVHYSCCFHCNQNFLALDLDNYVTQSVQRYYRHIEQFQHEIAVNLRQSVRQLNKDFQNTMKRSLLKYQAKQRFISEAKEQIFSEIDDLLQAVTTNQQHLDELNEMTLEM